MPNDSTNWARVHHDFHDVDEFTEIIRTWNPIYQQLGRGSFEGKLTQLVGERFSLLHLTHNRQVIQKGAIPLDLRTIAIPADPEQQFLWRRKEVTGDQLCLFPKDQELDGVAQPGFHVFTLSFTEDILEETIERLELPSSQNLFAGIEVLTPDPTSLHFLRQWLQRFFRDVVQNSSYGNRFSPLEPLVEAVEHELPGHLLKCLAFQQAVAPPSPSPRLRHKAMIRVEEYLKAFPAYPHTVRELCRVAEASERTLEYAFYERYGVSPKAYLQALRLNGVRKALRVADPEADSIVSIARQWGFWHMSQFAKEYHRLFGERPSETLTKCLTNQLNKRVSFVSA